MSLKASLRRAWPVLVAYGVFAMWGVGCFVASLALTSGGFGVGAGDLGVVIGILVATALGHVAGNLLGLLRLRLMVVVVAFLVAFTLAAVSGVALGPFALFLIVFVLAALGGYLGIASRLDVVAAWFPLSFAVGGALVWMNHHGALATFKGGSKHALWDPFTILCLAGAVFLMLVFLATRQSLGLTVWQEVGRPRPAGAEPGEAIGIARPGRGSIVVLLGFSIVVLGATALVSPYLFRTAPSDEGSTGGEGDRDDRSSSGKPSKDRGDAPKDDKRGKKGDDPAKGQRGKGDGDRDADGKPSRDGKPEKDRGKSGRDGDDPSHAKGDGDDRDGDGKPSKHGKGDGSGDDGKGDGKPPKQGKSDGSGDDGDGKPPKQGKSNGSDGDGNGDGKPSKQGDRPPKDPLGQPDPDHAGEATREALGIGLRVMAWFLALAAALFLLGMIAIPPFRRSFLLRHLERPLWPVSPTSRVMNLWRRAIAALALLEITPQPGEVPRDFARRAQGELADRGCDAPGLEQAAAIVEKIDYAGRGLGAGEEQTMRDAVMAVVRAVGASVGTGKKVAAAWGPAPEVEPP